MKTDYAPTYRLTRTPRGLVAIRRGPVNKWIIRNQVRIGEIATVWLATLSLFAALAMGVYALLRFQP